MAYLDPMDPQALDVKISELVARGELFDPGIPVGAHLSTPVVLPDGRVYGTICCFSDAAQPDLQQSALATVRHATQVAAPTVKTSFSSTGPGPAG